MYNFYGKHIVADLEGIPVNLINGVDELIVRIEYSIVNAGATIIGMEKYMLLPQGYTIFFVLKESHVSVHSYPECNSMFIDIFTCGNRINPNIIINDIVNFLCPDNASISLIERGNIL